ncbi:B-cell lymphoma 3 protein, partial [Fukomys damarensis]|uniref:B-cell lymphoma 3 protein n=1 Tax=Fukomys damarensis TaxID=885580 RepID=UPI0014555C54
PAAPLGLPRPEALYYPGTLLPLYPTPPVGSFPLLNLPTPLYPMMCSMEHPLSADIATATHADEDGDTPLHIAVVQGKLPTVHWLVTLFQHGGRELDVYNNLRQTPLHLAVITTLPAMVRLLVTAGASPMALDQNLCFPPQDIKSGRSPLIHAVENNSLSMVQLLLQVGAVLSSPPHSFPDAIRTRDPPQRAPHRPASRPPAGLISASPSSSPSQSPPSDPPGFLLAPPSFFLPPPSPPAFLPFPGVLRGPGRPVPPSPAPGGS